MASLAQMDRLIGKALFEPEFRELLLKDPEKAARSLRYRLDSAQLARIQSLNPETLRDLGGAFQQAIERAPYNSLSFW